MKLFSQMGPLQKKVLIVVSVMSIACMSSFTLGYANGLGGSTDPEPANGQTITLPEPPPPCQQLLGRECSAAEEAAFKDHANDLGQFRTAIKTLLEGHQFSDTDLTAIGVAACGSKDHLAFTESSKGLSSASGLNDAQLRKIYNAAREFFCAA